MKSISKIRIIAVVLTAAFLFAAGTITVYAKDSIYEPEAEPVPQGTSYSDYPYTDTAPPVIPTEPLTPPGTGTVIDNVVNENNLEFFTITSANGNIFFLIIDRQRESENVYFLNAVSERDLLALAEESGDTWESSLTPPPIIPNTPTTPEVEVEQEPKPIPEPESEQGGGMGILLPLIILMLGGGAAGYYFKIYKPKQQQSDMADDFEYEDDYTDEPELYTEDDSPPWDIEDEDNKDGDE